MLAARTDTNNDAWYNMGYGSTAERDATIRRNTLANDRWFGEQYALPLTGVDRTMHEMALIIVLVGTGLIVWISGVELNRVLFEVISAFATCGLSTNLSAELPPEGKYVLSALMFAGRLGTITLASALALRQRSTLYHYPEERPIIG